MLCLKFCMFFWWLEFFLHENDVRQAVKFKISFDHDVFYCCCSLSFITQTENIYYKSLLMSINSVPFSFSIPKKSVSLTSFKFGLSFVPRKLFTSCFFTAVGVCIAILLYYTVYILATTMNDGKQTNYDGK